MVNDVQTTPAEQAGPARIFATAGVGSEATRVEQARAVAEVAAAVQVAQMYPRDERKAWLDMEAACRRLKLAERAFYDVPNRGGSQPSVHLARELARIWGNMDYGVRETHRDDDLGRSEVLAHAWDQQTNSRTSRSFLVPHVRMVTDKHTKIQERRPLTDVADIYLNNQNQGARALRQCVFAIMPADFVADAQEMCRKTLELGDGKPLQQRIGEMIAGFEQLGVSVPRIEQRVGRSRGRWTNADVADLTISYGTLRRGEATPDEAFPPIITLDMVQASTGQAPPASAPPAVVEPGPDDAERPVLADPTVIEGLAAEGLPAPVCGFVTPDGPCNRPPGHEAGPQYEGYDGHDVIPPGEAAL